MIKINLEEISVYVGMTGLSWLRMESSGCCERDNEHCSIANLCECCSIHSQICTGCGLVRGGLCVRKCDFEERSRNHWRCGKAISITYSVYMSLALVTAESKAYYIVICGLSCCTIYSPHYLMNGTIFGKKLLNRKYVFWFSLLIFPETFLTLRRTERDMITNIYWSSCKVPVTLSSVVCLAVQYFPHIIS